MPTNGKTIKYLEKSKVSALRVTEEFIQDGQKFRKVEWSDLYKPLNLGSFRKPQNKDVVAIKIDVPKEETGNVFENLFK